MTDKEWLIFQGWFIGVMCTAVLVALIGRLWGVW